MSRYLACAVEVELGTIVIERKAAAQQHEHDHSQRPHVHSPVIRGSLQHLRRQISLKDQDTEERLAVPRRIPQPRATLSTIMIRSPWWWWWWWCARSCTCSGQLENSWHERCAATLAQLLYRIRYCNNADGANEPATHTIARSLVTCFSAATRSTDSSPTST